MPRLHLSEKNTSNGRGSAMSNIQNIQPRAPRRSLSSSSRAADGKESTHTSDMDLFDFDEFDYNDYGNGGDDIGDSDAIHGDKLKDDNCTVKSAEQTPAPPRTTDALSLSKKKNQSQPPSSSWSPSSSSSGNGSETLAQLSKRTKSNHNPTRKRKKASREFVSPTRRVVPTVSSQKITVSSLSKNNHAPNKKRESTKNYINNNNNKGNASNNTTVATKKQNDENKVNQSTIITANGKNHDSAIRSRKKNSQTSQQQKKQKTVKFQQQNEKRTKKKSGVLAASGKKGNKPNSSRAKQPQDIHDSDSSNDGLEDTDDEELEKNEKQAISTNSSSKANANHQDDSNTRSNYTFHKQQIQVLPLRAIAIDNRALPTFVGDAMVRSSFLSHIPEFVEGALEKGVLSASSSSSSISGTTIVAAFKHSNGAKDHASCDESVKASHSTNITRTDSPGRNSVVAHTAYLCESRYSTATHPSVPLTKQERALWVSEFLRPVNHGFVNDSGMNPIIGCGSNDGGGETSSMDSGAIKYEVTNEPKPRIPDGFHARDSWDYLGSLVDQIENKLKHTRHNQNPYSITLFTTDATLFADTNSSSHLDGLERFWKRIASAYQSNTVSAVTIMIVETSNAVQMMKALKTIHNSDALSSMASFPSEDCSNDYFESMVGNDSLYSAPNRLEVIRCVNSIRQRINDLAEAQQQTSSRNLADGSDALSDTMAPINVDLKFMEGSPISFQSLLQKWAKESFTKSYATSSRCVDGRLCFDLPETIDGIMCSISLDLQYTILPHSIESPRTLNLVEDMHCLSSLSPSAVEVVQTIPLSSVDSSLIYGVPMSARAGLEDDISRYDEMKMLVRQLWKHLGRNDLALVLRTRFEVEDGLREESSGKPQGQHHYSGHQLFLLVCEEAVQKPSPALNNDGSLDQSHVQTFVPDGQRKGEAPCHGVLYRYATKKQILHFGNEDSAHEAEEGNENTAEMSENYLDYIERSLDMLVKTGLNPLLN